MTDGFKRARSARAATADAEAGASASASDASSVVPAVAVEGLATEALTLVPLGTTRPGTAAATAASRDKSAIVMQGVGILRAKVARELADEGSAAPTLQSLGITNVTEVRERDPAAVMRAIEEIFADAADSILRGGGLRYEVPNRTASNQLYVPELDRIVLQSKTSTRSFESTAQVRKTVIMTRVMEMLHQVLRRNIHTTKRDLFYADVKLFRSQDESDAVLDDVACVIGCTRTSLHVVASEKGVVVGRVQFREGEAAAPILWRSSGPRTSVRCGLPSFPWEDGCRRWLSGFAAPRGSSPQPSLNPSSPACFPRRRRPDRLHPHGRWRQGHPPVH